MSTPELPPLHIPIPKNVRGDGLVLVQREALERTKRAVQARERILQARIAELEADLASFRDYHARTLDAAIDAARKP